MKISRFVLLLAVAVAAVWAMPARAQTNEIREKPPQYSYVSFWQVPRAQWPEMEKAQASRKPLFDKALADGTIIGYGNDVNLVHTVDGDTHADWFSSMSMAGLLKVLNQLQNAGTPPPVLTTATKHWDHILVARYYNWRPGSWQGIYTQGNFYTLKPDAPHNAVNLISRHLLVPLLEKLLADGTIVQYEIDTEAIHTDAPGSFLIFCLVANAEGLDKFNAAVREAIFSDPMGAVSFESMVELSAHRDYLAQANASYK